MSSIGEPNIVVYYDFLIPPFVFFLGTLTNLRLLNEIVSLRSFSLARTFLLSPLFPHLLLSIIEESAKHLYVKYQQQLMIVIFCFSRVPQPDLCHS